MNQPDDQQPDRTVAEPAPTGAPAGLDAALWRAGAHDLRSAVGVVLTYCEFLREESAHPLNPAQRESAGIIHTAGEGMLRLINQLSYYAKLAAGELPFDPQPVDLPALVRQAVSLNAAAAGQKKIQLTCAPPPGWPALMLDGERILEAVRQLIQNAIHVSPVETCVRITLQRSPHQVVCSVSDQGPGIALADQARLFQPFGRVPAPRAEPPTGSGFGLAIARLIVERHGGKIWLKSLPEQGATFHVSLPIPSPGHPAAPPAQISQPHSPV